MKKAIISVTSGTGNPSAEELRQMRQRIGDLLAPSSPSDFIVVDGDKFVVSAIIVELDNASSTP